MPTSGRGHVSGWSDYGHWSLPNQLCMLKKTIPLLSNGLNCKFVDKWPENVFTPTHNSHLKRFLKSLIRHIRHSIFIKIVTQREYELWPHSAPNATHGLSNRELSLGGVGGGGLTTPVPNHHEVQAPCSKHSRLH